MFDFNLALNGVRDGLGRLFDTHWRALAGAAFMCMAMAAIEYDEVIAPKVERLSDGWSTAATDLSRRLASFTL